MGKIVTKKFSSGFDEFSGDLDGTELLMIKRNGVATPLSISLNDLLAGQNISQQNFETTVLNAIAKKASLVVGKNIFNAGDFVGAVASGNMMFQNGFQEVAANTMYKANRDMLTQYFDASKTVVSDISSESSAVPFTTPSTAAYAKFGYWTSGGVNPSEIQIELGSESTAYEAYALTMSDTALPATVVKKDYFDNTIGDVQSDINILQSSVSKKASLVTGKNIFNAGDFVTPIVVGDWTMQSGLQGITPGTVYKSNRDIIARYYNSSAVAILDYVVISPADNFFTPSTAAYVKFGYWTNGGVNINEIQVELGEVSTAYEAYALVVDPANIPDLSALGSEVAVLSTSVGEVSTALDTKISLIIGKNKFDPALIIAGKYMSYDGPVFTQLSDNANSSISGYQNVLPSTQYTLSGVKNNADDSIGAFFNANLEVLNGGTTFDTTSTFTTPADCAFILFVTCYNNASPDYASIQLELGANATLYEAYSKTIAESNIPLTIARKTDVPDTKTFVIKSIGKNKFNSALIVEGRHIQYTYVDGSYIYNGLGTSAGSSVSGYQAVLPNTQYTLSGVKNNTDDTFGVFLDADFNVLNGGVLFYTSSTFTTPANCAFILFATKYASTSDYATIQLELGASVTTYEVYNESIAEDSIPPEIARKTDIPNLTDLIPKLVGKNKFDPSLIVEGSYMQYVYSNGAYVFNGIGASAGSSLSGYQPVLSNTQYTLSGVKNNADDSIGAFFNANLEVLNGGVTFDTTSTFTTPTDCAFILFVTKYSSTSNYGAIQFELGASATYYSAYNPIGGYPQATAAGAWDSNKILWMGTSIPAGNPSVTTPYPSIAAQILGANVINVALSGSLMRISNADGTQNTNVDYHTKNFARTKQEFQDLLSQFGHSGPYASYPSYTQGQIDAFKLNSYEEKLMTHLDCDLFVFDFSWNDYMCDASDMQDAPADITSRDRKTQWGAFNYVIDKLLAAKPTARIMLVGFWSDTQLGSTNLIHGMLSDYWCVPFLDLAKKLGWSDIINTATGNAVLRTYCVDGIHPHTDTTGYAERTVGRIGAGFINANVG